MEQLSLYLAEGVEECFSWIIIGLLWVVFMQEKGNHFFGFITELKLIEKYTA